MGTLSAEGSLLCSVDSEDREVCCLKRGSFQGSGLYHLLCWCSQCTANCSMWQTRLSRPGRGGPEVLNKIYPCSMSAMSQSPFLHLRAEMLCPCLSKPLPKQTKPGMLSLLPLAQCSTPSAFSMHSCLRVIFSGRCLCGGTFMYTHTCTEGCVLLKKKQLCQQIISSYFSYYNPLQASTKHPHMFDQVTIKEKYCAILANWTTYTLVSL